MTRQSRSSGRIGEIIDEMKRSGYDLCLILESTVTISPTQDHQTDAVPEPRLASSVPAATGELMRARKISSSWTTSVSRLSV